MESYENSKKENVTYVGEGEEKRRLTFEESKYLLSAQSVPITGVGTSWVISLEEVGYID